MDWGGAPALPRPTIGSSPQSLVHRLHMRLSIILLLYIRLQSVWNSDLFVCSMFLNTQTLGPRGTLVGALKALWRRSGALQGRRWRLLGRSWATLGTLLGRS